MEADTRIAPFWTTSCQTLSRLLPEALESAPVSIVDTVPVSVTAQPQSLKKTPYRARPLRLHLTKSQRQTLRQWIGTARFTYNQGLALAKNGFSKRFQNLRNAVVTQHSKVLFCTTCCQHQPYVEPQSFEVFRKELRKSCPILKKLTRKRKVFESKVDVGPIDGLQSVTKCCGIPLVVQRFESLWHQKHEWLSETPKEIRATAIKDLANGYKNNFKKGERFQMRFRKRDAIQSIGMPKSAIHIADNKLKFYDVEDIRLGKRTGKKIPKIDHDCRIRWNGRHFDLIVPIKAQERTEEAYGVVALDPGLRKFQTCFSQRECFSVNRNELLSMLKSKMDSLSKERRKKKKALVKCRQRLRNIVDDMHWKLCRRLTRDYRDILIPSFESQDMNGTLGRTNNRQFNVLAHYRFRQRLEHVASTYCGRRRVYVVDESYTSQCCGNCGILNRVGSSKEYRCGECGYSACRDGNASRNIYMRHVKTVSSGHVTYRLKSLSINNDC